MHTVRPLAGTAPRTGRFNSLQRAQLRRAPRALATLATVASLAFGSTVQAEQEPTTTGTTAKPAVASKKPARMRAAAPPRQAAQAFENPHGKTAPRPRVNAARDLKPGEVEVHIVSEQIKDLAGRVVRLHVKRMSIAEGDSESVVEATTDANGVARFTGQGASSDYVYTVGTTEGAATYKVPEFQFRPNAGGSRVLLPIFPATSDLGSLILISRGLMAIIPENNRFMVDLIWRIENYSQTSWAPEDVIFELPDGFAALTFDKPSGGPQFVRHENHAVRLDGTFTPGRHDLKFRFYMPLNGESSKSFAFPAKLNLGSFKVYLESGTQLSLAVEGFKDLEEDRNRKTGKRYIIASRDFMEENSTPPSELRVTIAGIPTPPAGRGVAVVLAGCLALFGLVRGARGRKKSQTQGLAQSDVQRAQELLLEELVALEQAFERKEVGRKTHERTRRQLLEAFARLSASTDHSPQNAA